MVLEAAILNVVAGDELKNAGAGYEKILS